MEITQTTCPLPTSVLSVWEDHKHKVKYLFVLPQNEQAFLAIVCADSEGEEVQARLQALEHPGLGDETAA